MCCTTQILLFELRLIAKTAVGRLRSAVPFHYEYFLLSRR